MQELCIEIQRSRIILWSRGALGRYPSVAVRWWEGGESISQLSSHSNIRQTAEDFVGNARFLVQRRLGAGAFGVVYEAFDRQERCRVALKVLRFAEADALYRFKKGFRSLADIRHPNLISFYELFTEQGVWFFSMELIHGVDFIDYLTGMPVDTMTSTVSMGRATTTTLGSTAPTLDTNAPTPILGRPFVEVVTPPRDPVSDPERTRQALLQLARGLHALHAHGKVHRDIKPTNVLVDGEGRVILLDFGLVAELQGSSRQTSESQPLVGTPAYMSPEQAMAEPGSPASDWYSVGVMLFQALSGELPFQGSLAQILMEKQRRPAPSLDPKSPNVPDDLEALCRGLMEPDPRSRLTGEQVLARLQGATRPPELHGEIDEGQLTSSQSLRRAMLSLAPVEGTFVGRHRILKQLEDAYDDCRRQVVMVYLRGRSGMGKSALLRHFVSLLDQRPEEPVVLSGRCYLQESVPYKALDSVIDSLSRYLNTLHRQEVEVLLPARVTALVRLFPVLLRVEAINAQYRSGEEDDDPQVVRRRACAALRELLDRLASRHQVVMVIDDLQWGDVDSFFLLDELFKGPDPPPFLFLGSYRKEDEPSSPFLSALMEQGEKLRWRGVDLRHIDVAPLTEGEAESMVTTMDKRGNIAEQGLRNILEEAGGSPLFLSELVRYSMGRQQIAPRSQGTPSRRLQDLHLRDLILARVELLSPAARRLLEIIAVAGKPVDLEVARTAADLQSGGNEAVAELRRQNLVRQTVHGDHVEVESYHDRIREEVGKRLSTEDLRQAHRQLALALESTGRADAETLAVHFQATEEAERARDYVIRAASRAEEALAFERAARLYRLALDLLVAESTDRYEMRVKLGDALANAGHSREAADTFIEAVGDSGTINPIEVQRHAAEKLLISGHIDRGLSVLRHVLRLDGMSLERSLWRSRYSQRWRRILLRLRGYRYRERQEKNCDSEMLRRIDTCWSVEIGLCLVDVLRASEFHLRHLLLALSLGEPRRIARGLAMEVFFVALEGGDPAPVLELAKEKATALPGGHALSLTEMTEGMVACSKGGWRRANRSLMRAEKHLRESRQGVAWELDTVQHFRTLALLHLGRWQELFDEQPRLLERLREQGDIYLEIHLLHWVESLRLLLDGRVDEARQMLRQTANAWSYEGFHYQHFGHLYASVQVALYEGQASRALELLQERWQELLGSFIQRLEMVFVQSYDLRGRTLLAAAVQEEAGRAQRLARVEDHAKRLEKVGSNWSLALASLLRAGCATLGQSQERVLEALEVAVAAFEASSMDVHASVARLCRAQVLAGCPSGEAADRAAAERVAPNRAATDRGATDRDSAARDGAARDGAARDSAARDSAGEVARAELRALGVVDAEPLVAMLAPGRWTKALV